MCRYILPVPLCDHAGPQIWALPGDESCPHLLAQLRRIYDPAEWACAARARTVVPFDLPPLCGPCRENIRVVRVGGYCAGCCRTHHQHNQHYYNHHQHCYGGADGRDETAGWLWVGGS